MYFTASLETRGLRAALQSEGGGPALPEAEGYEKGRSLSRGLFSRELNAYFAGRLRSKADQ